MPNQKEHFAQNDKDEWLTPPSLIEEVRRRLPEGITTDPCAAPVTDIGQENNYTEDDDGLSKSWPGVVWCNPPFSDKAAWLKKTIEERDAGNASLVFVVTPDSTDTISWWHEYIAGEANHIWFPEGRVKYHNYDYEEMGSPTFGTSVSIYGEAPEALLDWFSQEGHLVQTVTF